MIKVDKERAAKIKKLYKEINKRKPESKMEAWSIAAFLRKKLGL